MPMLKALRKFFRWDETAVSTYEKVNIQPVGTEIERVRPELMDRFRASLKPEVTVMFNDPKNDFQPVTEVVTEKRDKNGWCLPGQHGELVGGLGGMGDAIICLTCGREKYEEHWESSEVRRQVPVSAKNRAQVEAARNMKGGVNERVKEPDPEFDAWLRSKDDIFNPDYKP